MAKVVKKVIVQGNSVGLDKVVGELAKIAARLDKITGQPVKLNTNSAQAQAKALGTTANKMANDVERAQSRATKGVERFAASNRAAGKDMASLTKTSASALTIAYAEIAANVFAASAAFNALKAGAQFGNLLRSQEQLAAATGTNFTYISFKLKEATNNALDFQRSAQYASLGRAAGLSAIQIGKLAEQGTKASIALGRELGDSIDRIFRGTIKGEPELLDELGIIIRLGDASEEYAKQLGIRADKLTSAQKAQAIYNAVLKETEKFDGVNVDPDAFTRLAASIKDAALQFGNLITGYLSPLVGFLADNKSALVGLATALGAGVLGKALGAFGSDLAGAQNNLEALRNKAVMARTAIEALERRQAASRGIAQDIGSSSVRAREFREVSKLSVAALGDVTQANGALKILNDTLNNTDVKSRDLSGTFANAGVAGNNMAKGIVKALKEVEKGGTTTFFGIKNVGKAQLEDLGAITQAALLREAEYFKKASESKMGTAKTREQALVDYRKLTTQASAISDQLMLSNATTTFNLYRARGVAAISAIQVMFGKLGVTAARAGAIVSASLGWIGLIFGAVAILREVASATGATTNGLDSLASVNDTLKSSLPTLTKQIELQSKAVISLTAAIANAESAASAFDVITAETGNLVKALSQIDPGAFSNLFDVGSSDVEERLEGYVKYLKEIGQLSNFESELAKQGLSLGNIDDAKQDIDKLKISVDNFQEGLSKSFEKLNAIKVVYSSILENNKAITAATADYNKGLVKVDANLLKIANAQENNLALLEASQKRIAEFQDEYNRSLDENTKRVTEQAGVWRNIRDYLVEIGQQKGFSFAPLDNFFGGKETLSQEDIDAKLKAIKTLGQRFASEAQSSLAIIDTERRRPASYSTLERAELANLSERLAGTKNLNEAQNLFNFLKERSNNLTKDATEDTKASKQATEELILTESQAARAIAERAASLQILTSAMQALGRTVPSSEAAYNSFLDANSELAAAQLKFRQLSSMQSVSDYDLQVAQDSIAALTAKVNALKIAYTNLNPVQEVFGNSLKTIAQRTAELGEIGDLTAKGVQIENLRKLAYELETIAGLVDLQSIESNNSQATAKLSREYEVLQGSASQLSIEARLLENQIKLTGKVMGESTVTSAIAAADAVTALKESYAELAGQAAKTAKAEADLARSRAISQVSDELRTSSMNLEIGALALRDLGSAFGTSLAEAAKSQMEGLFQELNSKFAPIEKAIRDDKSKTIGEQDALISLERRKFIAENKQLVLTQLRSKEYQKELADVQRMEEANARLIERYNLLGEALDSAIDALFGVGDKSFGDILKSLKDGLLGNLFGEFKVNLKDQLKDLDIAGSLGKLVPESIKGVFSKIGNFFGSSGGGARLTASMGGILQGVASGFERNGFQGALIQGAATAIGAAFGGPVGAAIGSAIGGLISGTAKQIIDQGLIFNVSGGTLDASRFTTTSREKSFLRGTEVKTSSKPIIEEEMEVFLASFEAVNQSFTSALNKYAAYFEQEIRAVDALNGVVFGEQLSLKDLSIEEQQQKIQGFFQDYGDSLVNYALPGLKNMQQAGETLIDTLNRVTRITMVADTAFRSIFNLTGDGAKSLLGSGSAEVRKGLAAGVLATVRSDLDFAYSFVAASGLNVKVKMPKKSGFFDKVARVVVAVATFGFSEIIGYEKVIGAIGKVLSALPDGLLEIVSVVSAIYTLGTSGVFTAIASGFAEGGIAAAVTAGVAQITGTAGLGVLQASTTEILTTAITNVVSRALVGAVGGVISDSALQAADNQLADEIMAEAERNLRDALGTDNFGSSLEAIKKAMMKYSKAKFTLTADAFALNLETGLFEATEQRLRLFKSKGGKKNAAKLQAEYEEQLNLLNEYSDILTYLTLEAAGIDTSGSNLEAKAMGQIRAQFFDQVMSFFDGADAKEKEEAFNRALDSYSKGTSSTLELITNGIDGALNGVKASLYTIGGVFEKQKNEILSTLNITEDLLSGVSKDISGKGFAFLNNKLRFTSNQNIVETIYKKFIGNLGLSEEDQRAAYEQLAQMSAEEISIRGNLSTEVDKAVFTRRLSSVFSSIAGEGAEALIEAALDEAIPNIREKITQANAAIAAIDNLYASLQDNLPSGQVPSLVRFNKVFESIMANSPDPEVVAEMIKIGETISNAMNALFEVFSGFDAGGIINYLEEAQKKATSFSELGGFVASEFIAGTRKGLKDTFKNAIVEDFQKSLLGPLLAGISTAVSNAFAGVDNGLMFQLNDQEIAETEARLTATADILLNMLENPTLIAAFDKVGLTLSNITTKFLDLNNSTEAIAEVSKNFDQSISQIVANLELAAFSAKVDGDALQVAKFTAFQKFRDLNVEGLGTDSLTKPISEVIAKANELIASSVITSDNIGDVTAAIQALADVSLAARDKLRETSEALNSSFKNITDKVSSLTLEIIKAGTGNNVRDLENSGSALQNYLATVYLSVDKAKKEYAKAKLDGNLILAAEKAGELEAALSSYSSAQIDALNYEADLSKKIYDEQKQALDGLNDLAKNLKDFVEDIKFDDRLSILKPVDRLRAAEEDFNALRARILSGTTNITDLSAEEAQKVIDDSRRLLDLGREVYASGAQYTELYSQVMGTIEAAQAQVGDAIVLTDAEVQKYQVDSIAIQTEIRNIQLGTLSQLQLIAAELGVNGALIQAMNDSGTFNVALDPTVVRQYAYSNTEDLNLLAAAIAEASVGVNNPSYLPLMDTYLSGMLSNLQSLSIANVLGDNAGMVNASALDTLLSSFGLFSTSLAGFNFSGIDLPFSSNYGEADSGDIALNPSTGTSYDVNALLNQILAAPINNNLTNLQGNTTTQADTSNNEPLTRDDLLDVRLIEVLDRLDLVLAALPLNLRSAILQQNIATQRV